mgnify:FL=1
MNISLVLEKAECINEINVMLSGLPLTNSGMEVNGAHLDIKQLSVLGFSMEMRLLKPTISIAFEVTKKTIFANLVGDGIVSVTGDISYNISEDFIFSGSFKYLSHSWIDSPDVKIGVLNFPVKSIVDGIIEKQSSKIEGMINQYLAGTDLKQWIAPYIKFLQQEVELKYAYLTIDAVPSALRIENVVDSADTVILEALLIADAHINFGRQQDLTDHMPKLHLGPSAG